MVYFICQDAITDEQSSIVWKHDAGFSFIPLDPMNTDYQKYLSWVEQGNTAPVWIPSEHDLPIVTPDGN